MAHYRTLLDPGDFIGPQDFPKPKPLLISRVVREDLPTREGDKKKTSSPMIYFAHGGHELPRKFKVPKSVLYGLSLELGTDTDAWVGKTITLYATKCLSFGEVEECIRVRFAPDTEDKVRRWLKKRKANPSTYMLPDQRPPAANASAPAAPPAAPPAPPAPAKADVPETPESIREMERQAAIERGEA